MSQITDLVIDLETLGLRKNAAIATIGAVLVRDTQVVDHLYLQVNIQTALDAGGTVDASTISWWLQQSDAARTELHIGSNPKSTPCRTHLRQALNELDDWINTHANIESVHAWGNGAGFDLSILAEAYAAQHMAPPWRFWNERDLRTLLDLQPGARAVVGEFQGVKHHALHDALHEARLLIAARQLINQEAPR